MIVSKATPKPAKVKVKKMPVSANNIAKAASRVLSHRLVSAEVDYIQRTLGASSTEQEIDAAVIAVRKLPWSSIVLPE
jgi:hypothetical protein